MQKGEWLPFSRLFSFCILHSAFCILHFHSWGEGERGRRTDAAAQNGFAMRETEPQILAALDIHGRAQAGFARDLHTR